MRSDPASTPDRATSHKEHHHPSPGPLGIAILTISDTRDPDTDVSGDLIASLCEAAGHTIAARLIRPDDPESVQEAIAHFCDLEEVSAILMTGGTGLSARDRTFEAVTALLDRRMDGFGEIFRALSYAAIGPAAMLSRAIAGLRGAIPIFAMPGSPDAVRLAMDRLILPELGHVVSEARRAT